MLDLRLKRPGKYVLGTSSWSPPAQTDNWFRSPTILKYPPWNFHLDLCVLWLWQTVRSSWTCILEEKISLNLQEQKLQHFSPHCFFFLRLFQTFSHCKIFAGFIFLPNLWTVQKASTLTKGHFFSPKDVRWTACCSIDHCGIAPSQCSWVECTYGKCALKKTMSKQISGTVLGGGRWV